MLSLSLTSLLIVWTVTAVRFVSSLRNAEPQLAGLEVLEHAPHQLAA